MWDLIKTKKTYAKCWLDMFSLFRVKDALKEKQSEPLAKYWLGCLNYLTI